MANKALITLDAGRNAPASTLTESCVQLQGVAISGCEADSDAMIAVDGCSGSPRWSTSTACGAIARQLAGEGVARTGKLKRVRGMIKKVA